MDLDSLNLRCFLMVSCKGEVSLLQSKLNKFNILIINLTNGPSLRMWVEGSLSVFLSLSNLKQKISAEPGSWKDKGTW